MYHVLATAYYIGKLKPEARGKPFGHVQCYNELKQAVLLCISLISLIAKLEPPLFSFTFLEGGVLV